MIYLKEEDGYTGVFLKGNCGKGTVVYDLSGGETISHPTRTSVQVSESLHVENRVGRYINHACDPTCQMNAFFVVTLRDLSEGEEITFDYNNNEDAIAFPFECKCCGKMILGRGNE